MAIPWCTEDEAHDFLDGQEQDDCRGCQIAREIRARAAAHRDSGGCSTWPLCTCGGEPSPSSG